MKNFDADRRWLKCVMGWTRRDRTRGPNMSDEEWIPPDHYPRAQQRRCTFKVAMRMATEYAEAQAKAELGI